MEGTEPTGQDLLRRRTAFWYVKWVLACYGAAFGIFLLALIVSLPFVGVRLADWVLLEPSGRFGLFVVMLAVSPFIFKHLK